MTTRIRSDDPGREAEFEQLLGRAVISLDSRMFQPNLQGKVVMVTGAGGSIGSEICAQIASLGPTALIGFDQAETPLFQLERSLKKAFPNLIFHPEIGSVTRFEHVHRVLHQHRPSVLFHAAGCKHVPLMERQVFAAIENNLFGTWLTAEAAEAAGVDRFVMISTDKAVRPASVMGATKRAAEMVLSAMQKKGGTKFATVRLVNVIGSSGSVVTIFDEQMAAGESLTITDRGMERFLMTRGEAGELCLYASAVLKGGEIFVPSLGPTQKILELAERFIRSRGLEPYRDVQIEFTGARAGEKLTEELSLPEDELLATSEPAIRMLRTTGKPDLRCLSELRKKLHHAVLTEYGREAIELLRQMVPEYTPTI